MIYTTEQIASARATYNRLRYARNWDEFYKELIETGLNVRPFTNEFMVTKGEEFTNWVYQKMDENMRHFFTLMDNFLFRLKELDNLPFINRDCDCVVKLKDTVNGMEYYTDELRPATDEDFEHYRKIAADEYASMYEDIDFVSRKSA